MLDIAVNLCKNVIDYIITNKKIETDKKIMVSETLNKISEVLENTAISLRRNEYPHMNCALLNTLSNKLVDSLSEYMMESDVLRLSEILRSASEIEKQFAHKDDPDTIPEIERCAGEFRAMSLLTNL